jgi:hypothetical protein
MAKFFDGSGTSKKTLKPNEVWNYGYAENKKTGWKLTGNYIVSNENKSITVYVSSS